MRYECYVLLDNCTICTIYIVCVLYIVCEMYVIVFGYMQKTLVLQTTRFPLALALVISLNIRATATTTVQRFYISDDYIFVCIYAHIW